ncbi:MAG: hypothetical protein HY985_04460 [Magnetospirillum sp.]|nr:hypothetical protein [Magnetospirillum sp.]
MIKTIVAGLAGVLLTSAVAVAEDGTWDKAGKEVGNAWDSTKKAAGSAWGAVKQDTRKGVKKTKSAGATVWDKTTDTAGDAWDATKAKAHDVKDAIVK